MSDIEVFELPDDFDPLQDVGFDPEEHQQETDYLPPIPDAELSRVPEAVSETPEESIEKLIVGLPGQRFRLLHAVAFCEEPRLLDEVVADLDAAFPQQVTVYDSAQIVQLLERAGALASEEVEAAEGTADEPEGTSGADADQDYLTVSAAAPRVYTATAAGLAAVDASCGDHVVAGMLAEEPRYLPLYRTILTMTSAEGGGATKDLNAVIDVDPLCEEPRRFCTYFLGRLETAGAVVWNQTWHATDAGVRVLASDIFED